MQKVSIPKGTRDFGPLQVQRRRYILNKIEKVFLLHGFMPLETPTMENLDTLEGKYGEEGDKLLFRILESGEFLGDTSKEVIISQFILSKILKDITIGIFDKGRKWIDISTEKAQDYTDFEKFLTENIGGIIDHIKRSEVSVNTLFENNTIIIERIEKSVALIANYLCGFFRHTLLETAVTNEGHLDYIINALIADHLHPIFFNSKDIKKTISLKGLRYDLTVPFARYVVMNRNEITFPFKRYQMQPVWRADKPQKGRYREFWQCDADVVGSDSLLNEVDLVRMYDEAFRDLGITNYELRINNRKILAAMAEYCGAADRLTDITIVIDKADKIGMDGVKQELARQNFTEEQISKILTITNFASADTKEQLDFLKNTFANTPLGLKGVEELEFVFGCVRQMNQQVNMRLDLALARGLSYYTGCIFEVVATEGTLKSSIGGGGRYDNLTGIFGLPGVSGVGISFGLDRIYDVIEELNLFPTDLKAGQTKVLICCFDAAAQQYALQPLKALQDAGIAAELYPDLKKLGKQLDYANALQIPFALIIGDNEMESGNLMLKNLVQGTQEALPLEQIISLLK